jgi:23S rRNA (adenine2503-C2)-methyltransferase
VRRSVSGITFLCLIGGLFFRKLLVMRNLQGLTEAELVEFARGIGESPYRGRQIFRWLYARGAGSFEEMTDLARSFRERLVQEAVIAGVTPVTQRRSAQDGTTKYLFRLADGLHVESVLIPPASSFAGAEASTQEEQQRLTVCLSTQVGCALDCAFCATGTMGFIRNLTAGEIVDQMLQVRRHSGRTITNVVFMGMGEPMLNYDAVMNAAGIMTDGMNIAARRITLSTAGWADAIRRMGEERRKVKLAVSLHSAVDATRNRLMPVTRRFPLSVLMDAIDQYYRRTKLRVTYEYILFDGINDTDHELKELIRFARRVPCKINVIPFHSIAFAGPSGFAAGLRPSRRMEEAVAMLREHHLTVMVRSSAGEDIEGACGQLAVRTGRRRHIPAARPVQAAN